MNLNYARVGLGISRESKGNLLITGNYTGPLPTAAASEPWTKGLSKAKVTDELL